MIKASDFATSLRDRLIQSRQEKLIAYLGATRNIDIDRATEAWNRMGEESRKAFGAKYDEYVRKQEEAARKQQKLEKIQQDIVAFDHGLPAVFKGASLKDFKGTEFERYIDMLLSDEGRNMMLFGTTGIGKTRFAYALCREWIKRDESYEFITAVEFSSHLYSAYRKGYDICSAIRASYGAKHLIIDEVDKMRGNEQEFSWFSYLINYRYEKQLQTIVMGNKGNRSAEEIVGASVYSRLSGDGSIEPIYIRGKDRRLET